MTDIKLNEENEFVIEKDTERLDLYISEYLKLFSRNQIRRREVKAFKKNNETLREIKLSKPVFLGDNILIKFNAEQVALTCIKPVNLSIEIIYEDEGIIVLNKPQGIVTHPGISNYENTVVNFLFYYIAELGENFNGELIRPGIVHRLDKDTSGVLIVAKNLSTLTFLAKQFKEKTTNKVYIAVIKGELKNISGVITTFIDRDKKDRKKFRASSETGRHSVSEYKVLINLKKYSLIALKPKTGRTHQLRVHMRYMNTPILGDPIYSRNDLEFKDIFLMLHAYKLEINTRDDYTQKFVCKIPARFVKFLLRFYDETELDTKLNEINNFLDNF